MQQQQQQQQHHHHHHHQPHAGPVAGQKRKQVHPQRVPPSALPPVTWVLSRSAGNAASAETPREADGPAAAKRQRQEHQAQPPARACCYHRGPRLAVASAPLVVRALPSSGGSAALYVPRVQVMPECQAAGENTYRLSDLVKQQRHDGEAAMTEMVSYPAGPARAPPFAHLPGAEQRHPVFMRNQRLTPSGVVCPAGHAGGVRPAQSAGHRRADGVARALGAAAGAEPRNPGGAAHHRARARRPAPAGAQRRRHPGQAQPSRPPQRGTGAPALRPPAPCRLPACCAFPHGFAMQHIQVSWLIGVCMCVSTPPAACRPNAPLPWPHQRHPLRPRPQRARPSSRARRRPRSRRSRRRPRSRRSRLRGCGRHGGLRRGTR